MFTWFKNSISRFLGGETSIGSDNQAFSHNASGNNAFSHISTDVSDNMLASNNSLGLVNLKNLVGGLCHFESLISNVTNVEDDLLGIGSASETLLPVIQQSITALQSSTDKITMAVDARAEQVIRVMDGHATALIDTVDRRSGEVTDIGYGLLVELQSWRQLLARKLSVTTLTQPSTLVMLGIGSAELCYCLSGQLLASALSFATEYPSLTVASCLISAAVGYVYYHQQSDDKPALATIPACALERIDDISSELIDELERLCCQYIDGEVAASEMGSAFYLLAECYRQGHGHRAINHQSVIHYYTQAAMLNHPLAKAKLALIHWQAHKRQYQQSESSHNKQLLTQKLQHTRSIIGQVVFDKRIALTQKADIVFNYAELLNTGVKSLFKPDVEQAIELHFQLAQVGVTASADKVDDFCFKLMQALYSSIRWPNDSSFEDSDEDEYTEDSYFRSILHDGLKEKTIFLLNRFCSLETTSDLNIKSLPLMNLYFYKQSCQHKMAAHYIESIIKLIQLDLIDDIDESDDESITDDFCNILLIQHLLTITCMVDGKDRLAHDSVTDLLRSDSFIDYIKSKQKDLSFWQTMQQLGQSRSVKTILSQFSKADLDDRAFFDCFETWLAKTMKETPYPCPTCQNNVFQLLCLFNDYAIYLLDETEDEDAVHIAMIFSSKLHHFIFERPQYKSEFQQQLLAISKDYQQAFERKYYDAMITEKSAMADLITEIVRPIDVEAVMAESLRFFPAATDNSEETFDSKLDGFIERFSF